MALTPPPEPTELYWRVIFLALPYSLVHLSIIGRTKLEPPPVRLPPGGHALVTGTLRGSDGLSTLPMLLARVTAVTASQTNRQNAFSSWCRQRHKLEKVNTAQFPRAEKREGPPWAVQPTEEENA